MKIVAAVLLICLASFANAACSPTPVFGSSAPGIGVKATLSMTATAGCFLKFSSVLASVSNITGQGLPGDYTIVIRNGVCGTGPVIGVVSLGLPANPGNQNLGINGTADHVTLTSPGYVTSSGGTFCVEFTAVNVNIYEALSLYGVNSSTQ